MFKNGAQIIDIGAESARPGSDSLSYKEEIKRLDPILKKLPKNKFVISVDSYKIETQEYALNNGAHIKMLTSPQNITANCQSNNPT